MTDQHQPASHQSSSAPNATNGAVIRARLLTLGSELASLPAEIERAELQESAARRALKDAELTAKDRLNELGALAEGNNERERKAALLELEKKDAALHTLQGVVSMRADELARLEAAHGRLKRMFAAKQINGGLLIEHSAWGRLTEAARMEVTQQGEERVPSPLNS